MKCAECEMVFDGDTRFVVINGDRICEDCIEDMDRREILDRLGVRFDCVGFPEPERC